MENQEEKKIGLLGKILGKRNEPEFSAERAWMLCSYFGAHQGETRLYQVEHSDKVPSSQSE